MFETGGGGRGGGGGGFRASGCWSWRQADGHNKYVFSIFYNMMVCSVFSLESPHRGDSNEYRQYIIFSLKKENHPK